LLFLDIDLSKNLSDDRCAAPSNRFVYYKLEKIKNHPANWQGWFFVVFQIDEHEGNPMGISLA
jgi:hypothetical protein